MSEYSLALRIWLFKTWSVLSQLKDDKVDGSFKMTHSHKWHTALPPSRMPTFLVMGQFSRAALSIFL